MKKNNQPLILVIASVSIFHPSVVHTKKAKAVVVAQPVNLETELMILNGGNFDYIMDNIARLKDLANYSFFRGDDAWDVPLIKKLRHKVNSLRDTANITKQSIEKFKIEANIKHVLSPVTLEEVKNALAKLRERAHNVRKANMWTNTAVRESKNAYADRIKKTTDALIVAVNNIAKLLPIQSNELPTIEPSITTVDTAMNIPTEQTVISPNTTFIENMTEPIYPEALPTLEQSNEELEQENIKPAQAEEEQE